jgi:hypothetical protein
MPETAHMPYVDAACIIRKDTLDTHMQTRTCCNVPMRPVDSRQAVRLHGQTAPTTTGMTGKPATTNNDNVLVASTAMHATTMHQAGTGSALDGAPSSPAVLRDSALHCQARQHRQKSATHACCAEHRTMSKPAAAAAGKPGYGDATAAHACTHSSMHARHNTWEWRQLPAHQGASREGKPT